MPEHCTKDKMETPVLELVGKDNKLTTLCQKKDWENQ